MTVLIEIKVPDVGNVADIDVVEVLIQPGDVVALEQTCSGKHTYSRKSTRACQSAGNTAT
ncbi:MAG: pyruvate dehydrogenase E2 component (dihydrolipoamide acetyltransferase) [Methylococcaceae bacterium NSM2-1]|nr:MAG: pyruvate dehydrogenase E2 component (dihydrolipoamide acetyltransferase) [Methylococcaceae bacterium NSM2-1]